MERIGGTIHIALRDLAKGTDRLPAGRDEPVIVLCQAGTHGTMAMTVLRMLGYTNVRNLRGGLNAWKAAGFAVVTHATK